jgi:hypothetical protein
MRATSLEMGLAGGRLRRFRSAMATPIAVAVALTPALLPACVVPSLSDAASKTFAADNNCAAAAVVERTDLAGRHSGYYEVSGCNLDVIYVCGGTSTCLKMEGLCTPRGCDSDYLRQAHDQFVTEASCPGDRVTTVASPPTAPAPPPEIAADPARAQVWGQTQQDRTKDLHVVTARGCGTETAYECRFFAENRAPMCTRAVALPVVGERPEMLEALAAQMDASGQTSAAQALRARAQQLRAAGGTAPSPSASSSSAPVPGSVTPPSPAPRAR